MKIHLLSENGNFYKANLHSHTTVSDGKLTPEEIKKSYMAHGYSIVAYTDHNVFVTHNELADEHFLPLNGYEIDMSEDKPWGIDSKTCHFCLIALNKEKNVQNLYFKSSYIEKNRDKVTVSYDRAPIARKYDSKNISRIMKEAREDGFFVTYNHPVWSLESGGEYFNYHGMHAMEIVNFGSYITGHEEHNGRIYDNMLHNGEHIYCIAADDNHNSFPEEHPLSDSYGAFTMIKAEKLDYESVSKALLDGNFYASEGPEIYELYYDTDDGRIHIRTSEATRIVMSTGLRYNTVRPSKAGENKIITETTFVLDKNTKNYIRFTVRDKEGKEAYTNAYRVSDILARVE